MSLLAACARSVSTAKGVDVTKGPLLVEGLGEVIAATGGVSDGLGEAVSSRLGDGLSLASGELVGVAFGVVFGLAVVFAVLVGDGVELLLEALGVGVAVSGELRKVASGQASGLYTPVLPSPGCLTSVLYRRQKA